MTNAPDHGSDQAGRSGDRVPFPAGTAAEAALWREFAGTCRACALAIAATRLECGHRVDPVWLAEQLLELRELIFFDQFVDDRG